MKIMNLAMSKLRLDPRNARAHSKKNLAAIQASLERFGQQKPIVVMTNGTVIAGNGTVMAAKALGWAGLNAAIFTGTIEEARAYAIADNRSAELAVWDFTELAAQLGKLGDFELGFDERDIAAVMAKAKPSPEDFAPEKYTSSRLQHTCPSCGQKFSSPPKTALHVEQKKKMDIKKQRKP